MQGLRAGQSCGRAGCLSGQYLDHRFEGPDVHATGRALQAGHMGADGRQRKAPVLALLGARKVIHQPAAGVG